LNETNNNYGLDSNTGDGTTNFSGIDGTMNFSSEYDLENWLMQPFNPQIAPFGMDLLQTTTGLAVDSLDFLWSLPE